MTAAGFVLPGGESTSARLRRIAQERTQLAVALRAKTEELRQEQTARAASQQDLTAAERQRDDAIRLLIYALHLRMHGERAPGGDETWSQFDRDAEAYLRRIGDAS